jgi:hypothetical protein
VRRVALTIAVGLALVLPTMESASGRPARVTPPVSAASLATLTVAVPSARPPTRAQLPGMVLPDAVLGHVAPGLKQRYAFFPTGEDAAASTLDPNDTGADLKRLGRLAGYVRGRNAPQAFSPGPPRGLLVVGTSVSLWTNASAAAASIRRNAADGKRLRGKQVEGGLVVSFGATKVPALGVGSLLVHLRTRPTGGTDRFATYVWFRVGQLSGSAVVGRGDGRNADTLALELAKQLKRRMLAAHDRR